MKRNKIILHSEEMVEMIDSAPKNIIKWGETVIGIVFVILIIGSFLFKYPDTITCQATISPEEPGVWIVAKNSGKMKELLGKEGDSVRKDQIIAVIENTAKTEDVLQVERDLASLPFGIGYDTNKTHLNLGELQDSYANFISALSDYNNFINNNLYLEKINAETKQYEAYVALTKSMQNQAKITTRQNRIQKGDFKGDEILFKKGLVAKSEYNKALIELMNSNLSVEQTKSSILNSKLQATQTANDIIQLKMEYRQDSLKIGNSLKAAYNKLRTDLRQWRNSYAIVSPANGKLTLGKYWAVNQYITAGDKVFAVTPSNSHNRLLAKAEVSVVGAGKIKRGQKVNMMLNSYPYMEYGYLTGKVLYMSQIPEEEKYIATIGFAPGATTSYNKKVDLKREQIGTAEILTDERSLGERLIAPIFFIFKHNF